MNSFRDTYHKRIQYRFILLAFLLFSAVAVLPRAGSGQSPLADFDATWLDNEQEWFKLEIGIYEFDYIYQVSVSQLVAKGFPEGQVDPAELRLYEKGKEIPIEIIQPTPGMLESDDIIRFLGKRNDGSDEEWAYGYNQANISSDYYSLFTDKNYYWLTWTPGNTSDKRYEVIPQNPSPPFYNGFRDTLHYEEDNIGRYNGVDANAELSTYTETEGYYWRQLDLSGRQTRSTRFDSTLVDLKLTAEPIVVKMRMASISIGQREARLQAYFDRNGVIDYHTIASRSWSYKGARTLQGGFSPADLIDFDELSIQMNLLNESTDLEDPNTVNIDWYKLSYFRGFDFSGEVVQYDFWLEVDGNRSVEVTGLQNTDTVRVYDTSTGSIYETVKDTAADNAIFKPVEGIGEKNRMLLVKNGVYAGVSSVEKYEPGPDLTDTENRADFLIITREMFSDAAQLYADYRAQKNGMETMVVHAEDIWERFDYGLYRPVAIQRFLYYTYQNWAKTPDFVFILADGSDLFRNRAVGADEIPPFGYPASDTWHAMNFEGPTDWKPRIAIGRLTVRDPNEILAYLNKVQNYETTRPQLEPWMKRVAFLSGGLNDAEQEQLYRFNQQFAQRDAASPVAADTILFRKESNQPLDGSRRAELREIINNGTFLLHFFGHTSPNSWDLLTDDPSTYKNKNRYSVVLSLGCYSGQFASSQNRIISEEFVYAPNAAIAYIGGAGQGIPSSLNKYSSFFHRSIFSDTLRTLGEVNNRAVSDLYSTNYNTYDLGLIQNSIILGDPAIQLAYPRRPDYIFDDQPFDVSPTPTNLSDSLMNVSITLRNLGMRTDEEVDLRLKHVRPENRVDEITTTINPIARTRTFDYRVPIEEEDAGRHQFQFSIDPVGTFDEVSKANNEYSSSHIVYSTSVDIISPPDRSIITRSDPEFIVSSPTATEGEQYRFQVDSTDLFRDDRILVNENVESDRIKVNWRPDIALEQGDNYWWRSSISRPGEVNWRTASFYVDTTLEGSWWQQNKNTFDANELSPSINYEARQFQFQTVTMDIRTGSNSFQHATQVAPNYPASTFINGAEYGRLDISFHMVWIDGNTGNIKKDQHYDVHFGIFTNPGAASYNQLVQDINNMNEGDYAIIRVRSFRLFNKSQPLFRNDGGRLEAALRSIGGFKAGGGVEGNQPSQLSQSDGYILFGRKGVEDPSEVSEYIIRRGVQEADTTLTFNEPEGTMTSPLVGPVRSWNRLEYTGELPNNSSLLEVQVYGWDQSLQNRTLLRALGGPQESGTNDLTNVSAREYPYLQLVAEMSDPSQRTTPQLDDWRIQYEPLPEIAVDPNFLEVESDTVEQGFPYELSVRLHNIGEIDADTLIVDYTDIYNSEPTLVKRDTILNLESGRTRRTDVTVETLGKLGEHRMLISLSGDFLDRYKYNNYLEHPYFVRNDTTSPRVEVFVDNRFIPPVDRPIADKEDPNLEFISAQPTVDIYWKDNNPYLTIEDSTTLQLEVFSTNPDNKEVYTVDDPELSFVPASDNRNKNQAYAQFKPDFRDVKDSVITLRVLARDRTGNISEGENGYMMSVRVKEDVGVTSFYPYPNPMSNFTRFAFELHGHNVTDIESFKLRIYTLSGRPVREFDLVKDQYLLRDSRLQIGWNILRWDGTDADGDRLANGVYLYTITMRAGGETIPINNNEVEKIAIIR